MNFYNILIQKYRHQISQMNCFLIFLSIIFSYFLATAILHALNVRWVRIEFLLAGWVSWTFIEYILHRFWMHGKNKDESKSITDYHLHHHTHPNEIRINAFQRTAFILFASSLFMLSFYLPAYFNLVTGFLSGFTIYNCMHWILHQPWSGLIFPRLHRFHIYHHCKFPDTCYGVSVCWWDLIFRTTPPRGAMISERITDHYFGRPKKNVLDPNIQTSISLHSSPSKNEL